MFGGSDGVLLGCQFVRLPPPPLDYAKVGQEQSRVLNGDEGPSVHHGSPVLEALANIEILCSFERISLCLGCRCMIAPLEPAEVGRDQSRAVGGDNGPSVPHTSSVSVAFADKKSFLFCAYIW